MEISLSDFRAFKAACSLPIKPLTLLVGENSSGKTSVLAALAYLWRFRDRTANPSFNSPPFDVGSFDEIVHRTKGRPKPEKFILDITAEIKPSRTARTSALRRRVGSISGEGRIKLSFGSSFGQVSITDLSFYFQDYRLDLSVEPRVSLQVFKGKTKLSQRLPQQSELFSEQIRYQGRSISYSFLNFILNDLAHDYFRESDKSSRSHGEYDDVALLVYALESTVNGFPHVVYASSPVRSSPSRVYTPVDQTLQPDGTHTPYELNRIKSSDPERWSRIKKGLEAFGQSSGMFSKIEISKFKKGVTGPFQLKLNVSGRDSNLVDVGYGISQALPIISDMLESRDNTGFLFQQPEVHLHPRAQAALGSFFVDHLNEHPNSLIVAETHSDYMIDRLRISVKEKKINPDNISIIYFEQKGTYVDTHYIHMDNEGNLNGCPIAYRDFFMNEQKSLLGF